MGNIYGFFSKHVEKHSLTPASTLHLGPPLRPCVFAKRGYLGRF